MCKCAGTGVAVGLATMLLLSPISMATERAEAGQVVGSILQAARSNRRVVPPLSMKVEVTKFKRDNGRYTQETPIARLVKQYRQNGDHLDLVSTRYLPDGSGGYVDGSYQGRSVSDGRQALHRQGGGHTYGFVSKSDELSRRILFCDDGGKILDGFIPHNLFEGEWMDVFEKQLDRVSVHPQTTMVNDHACHVLEADTPYGTYTLWVDVACGGCLRQAKVRVEKDDLAWGKPLGQSGVRKGHNQSRYYQSLEMTLTDVTVDRVGELYLPMAGTYECRTTYDDGYEMTVKRIITRRNVVFHPDFEAMGAFQMDMPEGTTVFDQDVPGTQYQWFDGRLVPYVQDVLDEGIADQADASSCPSSEASRASDAYDAGSAKHREDLSATVAHLSQDRGRTPWVLPLVVLAAGSLIVGLVRTRTGKESLVKSGTDV